MYQTGMHFVRFYFIFAQCKKKKKIQEREEEKINNIQCRKRQKTPRAYLKPPPKIYLDGKIKKR